MMATAVSTARVSIVVVPVPDDSRLIFADVRDGVMDFLEVNEFDKAAAVVVYTGLLMGLPVERVRAGLSREAGKPVSVSEVYALERVGRGWTSITGNDCERLRAMVGLVREIAGLRGRFRKPTSLEMKAAMIQGRQSPAEGQRRCALGELVFRMRAARGLTREAAAEAAGASEWIFRKLECGERLKSDRGVAEVCGWMGLSLEQGMELLGK